MAIDNLNILDGGEAQYMGDGVFALSQQDEYGKVHTVSVTEDDLRAILSKLEAV